ncbi:MAG TPA: DUF1592 domain-containing protein, partial [Planctomycetes bacterium]|nr:DUF1592 domain-containing protein [Planctomycetota bacterium]
MKLSDHRRCLFLAPCLMGTSAFATEEINPSVPRFVKTYCRDCHNAEKEKGDRNFEPFLARPESADHHETLEEILEQLNLGEMPPEKRDVKRPGDAERRQMIAELTRFLGSLADSKIPRETILRRLTRYEYNYTMRDLLGVHPDVVDATWNFPADRKHEGFATVGHTQVLSQYQLNLYLDAARDYLDRALVFGKTKPVRQYWTFKPSDFAANVTTRAKISFRFRDPTDRYVDIVHGQPDDRRPNAPVAFAKKGVPRDGFYRIRVTARGAGTAAPYGAKELKKYRIDPTQAVKLAIFFVPENRFLNKVASQGRILAGVFDLDYDRPKTSEVTVWMPAGASPFISWLNGPGAGKGLGRLIKKFHPETIFYEGAKLDALLEQGVKVPRHQTDLSQRIWDSERYKGPRLRVFEMTLEGPLGESWPPASHRNIVGEATDAAQIDLPAIMTAFAAKAFRRPVTEAEIAHHIQFVRSRMELGSTPADAIKSGLAALLCSPKFLFFDEGDVRVDAFLNPHQLAARLSYSLWSSLPDDKLRFLARQGAITEPKVLLSEVERLLRDPRSAAFARHFTDAWLRLDKLGSMPPGAKPFPASYRDRLEEAM